jgi:hypothetical protein
LAGRRRLWIALVLDDLAHIAPDHEKQHTLLDRMRWVWWGRLARERELAESRRRGQDFE